MAVFKVVVSEPKSRKSFQLELDQSNAVGLVGKKIGEEFGGDVLGMAGYMLQITGGTDKDGFPMHHDLKGSGRRKLLLSEPPGYHPALKGRRKRKTVRGNTVSDAIVQINAKILKMGDKPLDQIVPKKEKPAENAAEKATEKTTEKAAEKSAEKEKPEEKEDKEVKGVKKEEKPGGGESKEQK